MENNRLFLDKRVPSPLIKAVVKVREAIVQVICKEKE